MSFRDTTFCQRSDCAKWRRCNHALTDLVASAARRAGHHIATADHWPCYISIADFQKQNSGERKTISIRDKHQILR